MKTKIWRIAGLFFCAGLLTISAADKKQLGGPNGGRFLEKTDPRAEFLVEKDHTVRISFYDGASKPVPATAQSVSLIAETASGKQKIDFEKNGESLVSKTKLPEGEGYNLVVQFKPTADAKPQNYRFKLDLQKCGECGRAEYACVCDE